MHNNLILASFILYLIFFLTRENRETDNNATTYRTKRKKGNKIGNSMCIRQPSS